MLTTCLTLLPIISKSCQNVPSRPLSPTFFLFNKNPLTNIAWCILTHNHQFVSNFCKWHDNKSVVSYAKFGNEQYLGESKTKLPVNLISNVKILCEIDPCFIIHPPGTYVFMFRVRYLVKLFGSKAPEMLSTREFAKLFIGMEILKLNADNQRRVVDSKQWQAVHNV